MSRERAAGVATGAVRSQRDDWCCRAREAWRGRTERRRGIAYCASGTSASGANHRRRKVPCHGASPDRPLVVGRRQGRSAARLPDGDGPRRLAYDRTPHRVLALAFRDSVQQPAPGALLLRTKEGARRLAVTTRERLVDCLVLGERCADALALAAEDAPAPVRRVP